MITLDSTNLTVPVIVAPMFLISGPKLVTACAQAGIIGTFPALNQRTHEGFRAWLDEITTALKDLEQKTGQTAPPYGVNLIVHPTNPRLKEDLAACIDYKVPLIITSLGAVPDVINAVHSYGGAVFHDVTNRRHAQKAAQAGVDGLIAVCAGAGGHAGTLSPFAFMDELKQFFKGQIVLAGSLSKGSDIKAARLLGADFAYMGTRFIATQESLAPQDYKDMIINSHTQDIIYTPNVSGIPANFLKPSLENAGYDWTIEHKGGLKDLAQEAKAWKDVWSAGQGVTAINDCPSVATLVQKLHQELEGES